MDINNSAIVTKPEQSEYIKLRKSIYIGNCQTITQKKWIIENKELVYKDILYNEGYFKIINEILDNSIDEYLKTKGKFSTKIDVTIKSDGTIRIVDNGRGISSEKDEKTGKYQVELAFCDLHSGSNWDRNVSIGMNGVGSSVTNFLSDSFVVETCDGKYKTKLSCQKNCTLSKITRVKDNIRGTSVEFKIDTTQFENINLIESLHIKNIIYKRLVELKTIFPKIKFSLNDEQIKETIWTFIDKFDNITMGKDDIIISVFYNQDDEVKDDISYVNGLDTYKGGTHLKYIKSEIGKFIKTKLGKKYKTEIKNIQPFYNKLVFVVSINNFSKPEFNTQNKTELINQEKEIKAFLDDKIVFDFISKKIFEKFEAKFEEIIISLNEKDINKKLNKLDKDSKKDKFKKLASFIDAVDKDRRDTILFLVEGDSAKSHFPIVRNKNKHGMLPLRGKVLGAYNSTLAKVLENKELTDLMNIVGLKIGYKTDTRYYDKIAILTDADVDGNHIASMLMLFFYKYFPHLYEQKRIVKVMSPIVICIKGKEIRRFYEYDDFLKNQDKFTTGWRIEYNKGLGSLTEEEYSLMINQPKFEIITMDDLEETNKKFEVLFDKNKTEERRFWLQGKSISDLIMEDSE